MLSEGFWTPNIASSQFDEYSYLANTPDYVRKQMFAQLRTGFRLNLFVYFSDWLRRWRKQHQRGRRKWKLWPRNLSVTGFPNTMTSPFSLVSTKTWTAAATCCSFIIHSVILTKHFLFSWGAPIQLTGYYDPLVLLRCPNTVDRILQSTHSPEVPQPSWQNVTICSFSWGALTQLTGC